LSTLASTIPAGCTPDGGSIGSCSSTRAELPQVARNLYCPPLKCSPSTLAREMRPSCGAGVNPPGSPTPTRSTTDAPLLGERFCSRLSPFQISAAKAPPGAALKLSSRMWFFCVNSAHVGAFILSLSEPSRPSSHIYSRSLELCFFLLWPRHSLETPPYSYFHFNWSGLLSALAARGILSPYTLLIRLRTLW
jgi:hypothetical protein